MRICSEWPTSKVYFNKYLRNAATATSEKKGPAVLKKTQAPQQKALPYGISYLVYIDRRTIILYNIKNNFKRGKKMKKITILLFLCLFTFTAQAKDKLAIVFAGSLGGSFNKFNSALAQDLSQWYDIEEISTGGSSTKGGKIFSSIDDRPIFMMSETAKRNVVNAIKGKEPFVDGVSYKNLVWGGKYYKSLCAIKGGKYTPDDAFVKGNSLKVAISDGPKMGNHIFDNFNRVVGTDHSIVPYSGSGKQLAALQTSDVDLALINDAKAVRGMKEGTLVCDYSTNPGGGNMANSLSSKLQDDYAGFKFGYMMTGHVKNMSSAETRLLHKRINTLFESDDSAVGPLVQNNGWIVEIYTQKQLEDLFEENKKDLSIFLK